MNREEIRKKWKKKELAEVSEQTNLSRNERMIVSPTKQVISPTINTDNGMWNRVIQNANSILQNMGLGAKGSFVNMAYGMQKSRETFSPNYKQTLLKQQNITDKLKGKEKGYDSNNILLGKKQKTKELTTIENALIKDEERIQKNIEETTNPVAKKLAELTPSIGNSLTGMALSTVNPILGAELFFGSAMGQYTRDAEQRGMNAKQSLQYGSIMGAMEGASEFIGGQLTKGVGKAILKGNTKQALKTFGLDIAENFLEEASIEPVQEIVASLTGGKETADFSNMLERIIESGIDGALTSIITGGASAGIGKAVQITNKIRNGEQISQQELKDAVQEIQKSGKVDVKNEIINNINQVAQNQQATMQNKAILQSNQQVIPQQTQIPQNKTSQQMVNNTENVDNQIRIDSENFAKQVDEVKKGTFPQRDMLTLGKTPKVLKDIGLPDLPITMTQKHLDTIMNKSGKHKGANYHGLGEEIVKQLPEAINNPLDVVKSNTKDDSIVLTTSLSDKENRTIIASIKIDGTGKINNIEIDSNVMTSAYGRNNYEKFMEDNIKNGNLLYDIDQGVIKKVTRARLQLPRTSNSVDTVDNVSTSTNIIPQTEENMQLPKRKIVDEVMTEELGEGKTRKHYQSVFESQQVGEVGKEVAKELYKKDTYIPISNLDTITTVNENISRNGADNSYIAFRNKLRTNEKITLQDVALGERLIQIYSQNGDYAKVNELIQDVAILGTELGQQVQAMSLIKKASPEGQLQYLSKLLERTNIKEDTDIKITEEMSKKILESKNQEELEQNLSEVAIEIAEQLPITAKDKIRSWRYLSMLGNPKTHIKNLGANVAMNLTQGVKNKVAGGIEDVTSVFNKNLERTKTLKPANKEQVAFAKEDAEYMKDLIDGGGKYDVQNVIQSNKRQFDNRALNAITEFNSNLLDVEDKIFLKKAYQQALQNYMSANNLKASDMEGKTLEKARQYASLQAQEATFHQFNALANTLSQVENKGGVGGVITSAVLPFKKTPMNIAKAGLEYSPVGLAKSITYDISQIINKTETYKEQLEEGKITQEQYNTETSKMITKTIDNMSKGLTGTGIAILGYFLAQSGILKAGNDGEDDEFKEARGEQEYAIRIGNNTYTLDWISPSAIPLFTGATIQQLRSGEQEADASLVNSALTAFAKTFEPMTEMSMLQGLTSAISSYEQGSSNMIFDLLSSAGTSYLGQFVPTALGQVARTIDPYERDTTSTKKGIEGKVDRFVKQTMNKLPRCFTTITNKKRHMGRKQKKSKQCGAKIIRKCNITIQQARSIN